MTKIYQIINFQYQVVQSFPDLEAAKHYIASLAQNYPGENFHVVELAVVYSTLSREDGR